MRCELARSFDFEAAHLLPRFPEGHKCRRLHGHSFRVEVQVEGDVDPSTGYLIDFGEIKRVVQPWIDRLDHRYLNEIEGLENPTAELLAVWIWNRIASDLPGIVAVVIEETCTSRCTYRGG